MSGLASETTSPSASRVDLNSNPTCPFAPRRRMVMSAVMLLEPLTISATGHAIDPCLIGKIPIHRLSDTNLKGHLRPPVQLPFDFSCIDCIAPVMSWPVTNESDLVCIGLAIRPGAQFVQDAADDLDHFKIGLLIHAANIIGLADFSGLQDADDGFTMIFDKEPVANMFAVAIDRQR